jgi:hypothetical protein
MTSLVIWLFPPEIQFFLAACCCPAILVLAFRLSGVVGSIAALTGSMSLGFARHSENKSVTDIHATPGLRHLYCYTFPRFTHSRVSFMPFDFLLCCNQYPNLSWDPQLWDWRDAGASGLFVQIG